MNAALPDCLIVLDTMGIRTDAAILGITALRFDIESEPSGDQCIEIAVDFMSNSKAKRTYDNRTMEWWTEQQDMSLVFSREGVPLPDALDELIFFYGDAQHLWVMGHGFENAILTNAYENHKTPAPWNFWSVMDGRTFMNVAAWLNGEQETLTPRGISSLVTARSRAAALRLHYNTLNARRNPERHVSSAD